MIRSVALSFTAAIMVAGLGAADPVNVFMYSEYIDPKVPEAFTKATGFPVKISVYEAQEDMLAKLKTGGTEQYDVVVATDVMIRQLVGLGLVKQLDKSKLPNLANLDPSLLDQAYDKGNAVSVPYLWGTVGLIYDKTKVSGEATWAWMFDAAQQPGPFLFMDESRTMLGCTNLALGRAMNARGPEDLQAAAAALSKAKASQKCLGFAGGVPVKDKVVAGEAVLGVVYNGDAARAIEEKPNLAFSIPKEGGNIWVDSLLITNKAPNSAGAHAFINYLCEPTVAAQNANMMRYATPNAKAMPLITPADLANPVIYPPATVRSKLFYLEDPGKDSRLLEATWNKVKSN